MNLENYFISLFENKYIGDDAAVVGDYIYSKDAFFENVHFKRKWMSCYQIARKSMLVNISDAIAMNAKPRYALMSVAMPKSITKEEMRDLAKGFQELADQFGMEIIGGDTISNTKLDITITVVSESKKPLLRNKARINNFVAYTGELGKSQRDLQRLMSGGKIHSKSKFVDIKLRSEFISKAQRFLLAGMDISDGLFSDLAKLSEASKIGYRFLKPMDKKVACSGEEYEMLVTFDPRDLKSVIRRAAQSRTKLNVFAKAVRKRYVNRCKSHHF